MADTQHREPEPGRALFEALTDPVIVVEASSGLILDVNPATVQTYGYAPEELLGQRVSVLSSEGGPPSPLVQHRRKDGTTFPVEVSTSVMDWAGRKAILHVVRDVTLVASAFHGSPLLLAISDLVNDRYLEVNDAFCARVGFSREEMVGRTAVELGLIDAPERDRLAKRLMESLPTAVFELVIRTRAGRPVTCRYWGRVLHTGGGPRLFAAAEDITEHKHADEALEKSEARFELAMDATSDGVWDWDIATDAAYFSPGYYRMLGFDAGSFTADGRSWSGLIHSDDRPAVLQANQDCIEGRRERFEVEYRMRSKSGDWRWVLGRGKAVGRDRQGRALRLVGTHVDITERKRLEAGLAQSDRLASMGMLAAGVAHEINNPLS
jgi:PAS domain S-box-containing protein